jgi:hypothetical protein
MEKKLNASILLLRERKILGESPNSEKINQENKELDKIDTEKYQFASPSNSIQTKYIRDYLVRRNYSEEDFIEVRCAVVGML